MSNLVTVQEKLDRAKILFGEAKAILVNPEAPAEDKAKIEPLMEEAKALRAEAAQLAEIERAAGELALEAETRQPGEDPAKQARKDSKAFKDWNEFLYKVWEAGHPSIKAPPDSRLQAFKDKDEEAASKERKDMAESVGATGGFLVPVELDPQVRALEAEQSIVAPRATTIRMRRRQVSLPVLDQTGTTAGVPHWFGGMQFYWAEEAEEKELTDPKFRQVILTAHKLIGYTRASDELVDDAAISMGDFLNSPMGFAGGAAWMKDYAFLRGGGGGQPQGVINAPATIVVPRAADAAVGIIDLANMVENFLPSGRGLWVYTQSMLAELIQMAGPAGNPSYFWQPSAREGVPDVLFGMPAMRSEKVPMLGRQGDIGLFDFRYYLVGDRQATTIESTKFDRWRHDQTSWRMVTRVDGQPWLSAPLTYEDGLTQVSPFVVLGEKSS